MSLSQIALNNIGHLRRMKNRLNGDIMHVDCNIVDIMMTLYKTLLRLIYYVRPTNISF